MRCEPCTMQVFQGAGLIVVVEDPDLARRACPRCLAVRAKRGSRVCVWGEPLKRLTCTDQSRTVLAQGVQQRDSFDSSSPGRAVDGRGCSAHLYRAVNT